MNTRDYTYRAANGEAILLRDCLSEPQARRRAYGLAYRTTLSETAALSAAESVRPLHPRRAHRSLHTAS